jgi:hypothetical protein
MEAVTETRWLVLATDGRHVTLGRHRDPEPEEIDNAERGLKSQNLSGWLVLMKGGYYTRKKPQLMMVRPLGNPGGLWDEAVANFESLWRTATRPAGKRPQKATRDAGGA